MRGGVIRGDAGQPPHRMWILECMTSQTVPGWVPSDRATSPSQPAVGPTPRPGESGREATGTPAELVEPSRGQRLRTGAFALLFAPVALVLMGLAVTDLQVQSSVGQPLSSSEGLVGLLVATLLLTLIAMNSDQSSAGMVVTTVASLVVGTLQILGVSGGPLSRIVSASGADVRAAMVWSLYPLGVSAICLGVTLANVGQRRRVKDAVSRVRAGAPGGPGIGATPGSGADTDLEDAFGRSPRHLRARTMVILASLLLVLAASLALVWAAPDDTLEVARLGLPGILVGVTLDPLAGVVSAACLGIVAWSNRWSSLGPVLASWVLMIVPAYFVLPVWASLTGHVATPGASPLTALSLSAPVVTALGLVLTSMSLGVYWTRRHLDRQVHPEASGTI